jgi:hypothetical protein
MLKKLICLYIMSCNAKILYSYTQMLTISHAGKCHFESDHSKWQIDESNCRIKKMGKLYRTPSAKIEIEQFAQTYHNHAYGLNDKITISFDEDFFKKIKGDVKSMLEMPRTSNIPSYYTTKSLEQNILDVKHRISQLTCKCTNVFKPHLVNIIKSSANNFYLQQNKLFDDFIEIFDCATLDYISCICVTNSTYEMYIFTYKNQKKSNKTKKVIFMKSGEIILSSKNSHVFISLDGLITGEITRQSKRDNYATYINYACSMRNQLFMIKRKLAKSFRGTNKHPIVIKKCQIAHNVLCEYESNDDLNCMTFRETNLLTHRVLKIGLNIYENSLYHSRSKLYSRLHTKCGMFSCNFYNEGKYYIRMCNSHSKSTNYFFVVDLDALTMHVFYTNDNNGDKSPNDILCDTSLLRTHCTHCCSMILCQDVIHNIRSLYDKFVTTWNKSAYIAYMDKLSYYFCAKACGGGIMIISNVDNNMCIDYLQHKVLENGDIAKDMTVVLSLREILSCVNITNNIVGSDPFIFQILCAEILAAYFTNSVISVDTFIDDADELENEDYPESLYLANHYHEIKNFTTHRFKLIKQQIACYQSHNKTVLICKQDESTNDEFTMGDEMASELKMLEKMIDKSYFKKCAFQTDILNKIKNININAYNTLCKYVRKLLHIGTSDENLTHQVMTLPTSLFHKDDIMCKFDGWSLYKHYERDEQIDINKSVMTIKSEKSINVIYDSETYSNGQRMIFKHFNLNRTSHEVYVPSKEDVVKNILTYGCMMIHNIFYEDGDCDEDYNEDWDEDWDEDCDEDYANHAIELVEEVEEDGQEVRVRQIRQMRETNAEYDSIRQWNLQNIIILEQNAEDIARKYIFKKENGDLLTDEEITLIASEIRQRQRNYMFDQNVNYITENLVLSGYYDRKCAKLGHTIIHDVGKLTREKRSEFMRTSNYLVLSDETKVGSFDYSGVTGLPIQTLYKMNTYMIGNDLLMQNPTNFVIVCGFGDFANWVNGMFSGSNTTVHSTKVGPTGTDSTVTHNGKDVFKKQNNVIVSCDMRVGKVEDFPRIVWKVAHLKDSNGKKCIIKLFLPDDTIYIRPYSVLNWNGHLYAGKCRCNQAIVLEIQEYSFEKEVILSGAVAISSHHDQNPLLYTEGKLMLPDAFDLTPEECSHGIHVFEKRHHIQTLTGDEEVKPIEIIRTIMPNFVDTLVNHRSAITNGEVTDLIDFTDDVKPSGKSVVQNEHKDFIEFGQNHIIPNLSHSDTDGEIEFMPFQCATEEKTPKVRHRQTEISEKIIEVIEEDEEDTPQEIFSNAASIKIVLNDDNVEFSKVTKEKID